MGDPYQALSQHRLGRGLVRRLGLPDPVPLRRFEPGHPLVEGPVLLGGSGRLVEPVRRQLMDLGVDLRTAARTPWRGLVFDASDLRDSSDLAALPEFFAPLMRSLDTCARVIVLATPPELTTGAERIAQRALEGFVRSVAKEVGRGGTAQLVHVRPGAEGALSSTLGFLLSPKSAYVSGQVIRVGSFSTATARAMDPELPLAGRTALVTGAGRGIGEAVARVLHRDGARIIGVDVPQAAAHLIPLMSELGGQAVALDLTVKDAPQRLAAVCHDGVDVVVHNAGITRDRRLANLDRAWWNAVVEVNLRAPERITAELVDQGLLTSTGRVIGVSSVAGIAGNIGQTSYATSKAGVIGLVDAWSGLLSAGQTINAIAPGFIETKMTAAVPLLTRQVARRLNSLSQAGQPVDVAEAVAWLAHPGSGAVSGNLVRVCGQMMLGA